MQRKEVKEKKGNQLKWWVGFVFWGLLYMAIRLSKLGDWLILLLIISDLSSWKGAFVTKIL